MCENCAHHKLNVKNKDAFTTLEKFVKEVKVGNIEYVAGSSDLGDIDENFDIVEKLMILNYFFRCKDCGKLFHIGLYCRGEPICTIVKKVPGLDYMFDSKIWDELANKHGTWKKKSDWKKA